MAYQDWVKAFPTHQTMHSKGEPGNGVVFQLEMRVYAKGNGFFRAPGGSINTHPVKDEQQAIAVFLDLWHKAQAEAQAITNDAQGDDTE